MTTYVNFFFHCEDFISVHSQHATLRLVELFERHGLKADFYLTGMVVERMLAESPEAIDAFKRTGMPISYHSDHHAPFPTIWQRVRDLGWDEAVELALFQENGHLNPCTGELTDGRPNQMSLITETFGRPPVVSIGAAAAHAPSPIRYAHHQMGVPMAAVVDSTGPMLGLPLVWQNGMLRGEEGPHGYFFLTERFRKPLCGKPQSADQLPALFDMQLDLLAREEENLISIAAHDFSFALTDGWIGCYLDPETRERRNPSVLRASPPLSATKREEFWRLFETSVEYFAQRKDVEIVTAEDMLGWVEPLVEVQPLSRGEVLAAAEYVLENWAGIGYPPTHVEVGDLVLSLAECYQALVYALAGYRRDGALPQEVIVRDLLGPTDTPMTIAVTDSNRGMDRFMLDGERVCELAAAIEAEMSDRIPGVIDLNEGERAPLPLLKYSVRRPDGLLHPAEFLYLAAQVARSLGQTGEPGRAMVMAANLFPERATFRWRIGPEHPPFTALQEGYSMREWLTELQRWAIKPAKLR
ncbi:MAG: hypothetical protein ABIK79_09310, partial [Chloroflexota bacterium]